MDDEDRIISGLMGIFDESSKRSPERFPGPRPRSVHFAAPLNGTSTPAPHNFPTALSPRSPFLRTPSIFSDDSEIWGSPEPNTTITNAAYTPKSAFPMANDSGFVDGSFQKKQHQPYHHHQQMRRGSHYGTPMGRGGGNRYGGGGHPPHADNRQNIACECRFGEFGIGPGQFTEPSGLAVTLENNIAIADTNNHRIQVYARTGEFLYQFGEQGKREGQLSYPLRVAVNPMNGNFVITERIPSNYVQVYDSSGQFLRRFGANVLMYPRGVCVDQNGLIVVIECKVMRVVIFDSYGNVVQQFSCDQHLQFPNNVCTNDTQEIFISDNRLHCIKVFTYAGEFVRQIGWMGIINYPVGVAIDSEGDVIICDNHKAFNITIFDQNGNLKKALRSTMRHQQCFDMALFPDRRLAVSSKDSNIFVYRYGEAPGIPGRNVVRV